MGLGRVFKGLFFWTSFPNDLDLSCIPLNKLSLCNMITNDKNFLKHSRMGHTAFFPYSHCHVFPLAKQSHAPFPSSNNHANNIFSLIHVDVWGPYLTTNRDRSRLFLTIVDDYSCVMWVFLMQSKGQVLSHLKMFFSLSKNQFGKSILHICTNNGKEFFNNECALFFSSHGVLHESSCTYTLSRIRS